MKKAVCLVLALILALSLCACSSTSSLMNGYEWGQNEAQAEKVHAQLEKSGCKVLGKEAKIYQPGFDSGKLNAVYYRLDSSITDYYEIFQSVKEDLISKFGNPDKDDEDSAVWYVGDDIVSLYVEKGSYGKGIYSVTLYSVRLDIKHTS